MTSMDVFTISSAFLFTIFDLKKNFIHLYFYILMDNWSKICKNVI